MEWEEVGVAPRTKHHTEWATEIGGENLPFNRQKPRAEPDSVVGTHSEKGPFVQRELEDSPEAGSGPIWSRMRKLPPIKKNKKHAVRNVCWTSVA